MQLPLVDSIFFIFSQIDVFVSLVGIVWIVPCHLKQLFELFGQSDACTTIGRYVNAWYAQFSRQLGRLFEHQIFFHAKTANFVRNIIGNDNYLSSVLVLGRLDAHLPRNHAIAILARQPICFDQLAVFVQHQFNTATKVRLHERVQLVFYLLLVLVAMLASNSGQLVVMIAPYFHQRLAEHLRKVVGVRGAAGLGGEALLLQVIARKVWRAQQASVQRALFVRVALEIGLASDRVGDLAIQRYVQVVAALVGEKDANGHFVSVGRESERHLELGLEHAQLPQPRAVLEHHAAHTLLHFQRVDAHARHKAHVNVVAVCFVGHSVRKSALELVERLEQCALGLRLQVLVAGLLGHQVRVADDAAGKKSVVGDLLALGHLGSAQPIDFELKGHGRLKVTINFVLLIIIARSKRKKRRLLFSLSHAECQTAHFFLSEKIFFRLHKLEEHFGQRFVVFVAQLGVKVAYEHVKYVYGVVVGGGRGAVAGRLFAARLRGAQHVHVAGGRLEFLRVLNAGGRVCSDQRVDGCGQVWRGLGTVYLKRRA
ncbi:hypothetical protein BpHYR1_051008 [Brachionus plicatilis]|uniref:Uncharacterized protein n=1 Tax=Brachionus plicatilis TaxID=10195 RepID=A0A3M7SQA6_BRAPC|nr:hypothetical protein BpHYR1_051008 [Brachionus plicatilis]